MTDDSYHCEYTTQKEDQMTTTMPTCTLDGCDEPVRLDPKTSEPLKYCTDRHRLTAADRAYRARKAQSKAVDDDAITLAPIHTRPHRGRFLAEAMVNGRKLYRYAATAELAEQRMRETLAT